MEIRFPRTPEERAAADALVDREYRTRGYVERLSPLDGQGTVVFVAVENGVVLGTVSVVLALDHLPPTADYFGFSITERYPQLGLPYIMEIGRLAVANGRHKSIALCGLIAAMQYWGDSRGVKLSVVSLKPSFHIVLNRQMGIETSLLAGPDSLVRAAVPMQYHGYFFPPSSAKRPSAYSIDLSAVRSTVLGLAFSTSRLVTISPEIMSRTTAA